MKKMQNSKVISILKRAPNLFKHDNGNIFLRKTILLDRKSAIGPIKNDTNKYGYKIRKMILKIWHRKLSKVIYICNDSSPIKRMKASSIMKILLHQNCIHHFKYCSLFLTFLIQETFYKKKNIWSLGLNCGGLVCLCVWIPWLVLFSAWSVNLLQYN